MAPLLGLLGTVTGIIGTFGVIQAFGNANPSLMAGGISEALMTTATGLVVAVPILIVHSVLRGRAERIIADAERHAASMLTLMVSRTAAAAPTVSAASDATAPSPAESAPEPVVVAAQSKSGTEREGNSKRKRASRETPAHETSDEEAP